MRKLAISIAILTLGLIILYSIPLKVQSFEEIYEQKDEISSSLLKFRQIPLRKITNNGKDWNYLNIGKGEKAILFLHGMTGSYDVWWQQINYLKSDYRIISLTYPPVDNLKEMADATLKILDKEKISKTHLVGSSLGGYFAQYLASNYPEKVEKVVFANTFPINDQIKQDNKIKAYLMKNVPEWLLMNVMRKGLYKDILPAGNNSKLLEAIMLEQFSGGMSKKQLGDRYACVVDNFEQNTKSHIPILIIESDNDPLVKVNLREKLKETYPEAKVVTLHKAGHFPYINKADRYNEILESFFKSE